ncbi:hypothetical protein [Limosilactobacillus allomucosae]|uniref:hypothetical protein n=1 Tax=Limosilactobacillus allomucosae TaxID=3142938 RepID=UPI0032639929
MPSIEAKLARLNNYCRDMERRLDHIKVEYDVKEKFIKLNSRLVAPRNNTVYRLNVPDESATIKNIISNVLLVFEKVPLNKIIIEADVDDFGIAPNSLKVGCQFLYKNAVYDQVKQDVISSLHAISKAERYNVISVPANMLQLGFDGFQDFEYTIIYDYQNSKKSSCQQFFFPEFTINLLSLVKGLLENSESIKALLSLSLLERTKLVFLKGEARPNITMDYDGDSFDVDDVHKMIQQLDSILLLVPQARIGGLWLKEIHSSDSYHYYHSKFALTATKNLIAYQFNLTQEMCNGVVNVFNKVIENYSLINIENQSWKSIVHVDVSVTDGYWNIRFKDYYVDFDYQKHANFEQITADVKSIRNAIGNSGIITAFNWTVRNKQTTKLLCRINFDSKLSVSAPMNPQRIFAGSKNEDQITRCFQLINASYYLVNENYVIDPVNEVDTDAII